MIGTTPSSPGENTISQVISLRALTPALSSRQASKASRRAAGARGSAVRFAYLGSRTPNVCPGLESCFRLPHLRNVLREANHHIECIAIEEIHSNLPLITRTLNAERNAAGALRRLLDCGYLGLCEAVPLRCRMR